MPQQQMDNLDKIAAEQKNNGSKVVIWVTPNLLNYELRNHWEKNRYKLLDADHLMRSTNLDAACKLYDLAKSAGIWSGAGDILKLLILTRPLVEGNFGKRFYLEGDNIYPKDFSEIIQNRNFVFHCYPMGTVRCDSMYVDISAGTYANLEGIDPAATLVARAGKVLNAYLGEEFIRGAHEGIVENFPKSPGQIIRSFGSIVDFVIKIIFTVEQKIDFSKLINNSSMTFCQAGMLSRRSWTTEEDIKNDNKSNYEYLITIRQGEIYYEYKTSCQSSMSLEDVPNFKRLSRVMQYPWHLRILIDISNIDRANPKPVNILYVSQVYAQYLKDTQRSIEHKKSRTSDNCLYFYGMFKKVAPVVVGAVSCMAASYYYNSNRPGF